jgi:hypothetical protein
LSLAVCLFLFSWGLFSWGFSYCLFGRGFSYCLFSWGLFSWCVSYCLFGRLCSLGFSSSGSGFSGGSFTLGALLARC